MGTALSGRRRRKCATPAQAHAAAAQGKMGPNPPNPVSLPPALSQSGALRGCRGRRQPSRCGVEESRPLLLLPQGAWAEAQVEGTRHSDELRPAKGGRSRREPLPRASSAGEGASLSSQRVARPLLTRKDRSGGAVCLARRSILGRSSPGTAWLEHIKLISECDSL